MEQTINFNGILVEFERVKAIVYNDFSNDKIIKIELNKRKEFIFNPEKEGWEIQEFDDEVIIEFPDSEDAKAQYSEYRKEWEWGLKNR